jgi:hypothetical protein
MDNWDFWARETFGGADLGDVRRTSRLVQMAAQAGRRPSGKISSVFQTDAERQGAYDFVESEHVHSDQIRRAVTADTAARCSSEEWVYIPLDGTSLKFWDGTGRKDFGSIGTYSNGATGLKLYNALAVSPAGVPIGVAAQVWWRRPRERVHQKPPNDRRLGEKETRFFIEAIDQVTSDFSTHAPETRCWFQIDRGGDAQAVLRHLDRSGHWFTVRAHVDRPVFTESGRHCYLWAALRQSRVMARFSLELPCTEQHPARLAHLVVRAARVLMRLRDKRNGQIWQLPISAVYVAEAGAHRTGQVEWMLMTNREVRSGAQARRIVAGYTLRWRIEDFHKTWKSGACDVEGAQLHASERVIRWATLLSAVAARIERLKHLSRTQPDEPASIEFEPHEIRALLLLRQKRKKKNEVVPKKPTIAQATLWIAEMGGYTGKSSGGPPGSITIARGLDQLHPAAELLAALDEAEK